MFKKRAYQVVLMVVAFGLAPWPAHGLVGGFSHDGLAYVVGGLVLGGLSAFLVRNWSQFAYMAVPSVSSAMMWGVAGALLGYSDYYSGGLFAGGIAVSAVISSARRFARRMNEIMEAIL